MIAEVARPSGARARENSVVLRISRAVFHRVLGEFPKEAARIRTALATRTRKMSGELEELRSRALGPVR